METNENIDKVWIVQSWIAHEGSSIDGVFSSREKAIESIQTEYNKKCYPFVVDKNEIYQMKDREDAYEGIDVEPFEIVR